MNGECKGMLVHPLLQRTIGLLVESDEWETDEPLHVRYDGKRIATWTKDKSDAENKQNHMVFEERNEAPKWQN